MQRLCSFLLFRYCLANFIKYSTKPMKIFLIKALRHHDGALLLIFNEAYALLQTML